MASEIETRADFSLIRYAQCWEDADILLDALDIKPGSVCLSIASAGDNSLAMLARGPARVIALDLSPVQLHCLALRIAAYRELTHPELLELIGSRESDRRAALYQRCRKQLPDNARSFWDASGAAIRRGIGSVGKFEHYFEIFRRWVMPLIHSRATVGKLLEGGDRARRLEFYENEWNTRRWRLMFNLFFSRRVMGRLGRDPDFFRYVEGSVAERIMERARHAFTELDPAENPYLHWILTGRHNEALPFALRAENFDAIRNNLDRIEWHCASIEDFLARERETRFDAFNLSDIFEYMSVENCAALLERLADAGRPGARLAYWNMLAPRRSPARLAHKLRPLDELASRLFFQDKAFFYSAFVVEEVCR